MFGSTKCYVTKRGKRWLARWRGPDGKEQSKGGFLRERDAKEHVRILASEQKGGCSRTVEWLCEAFLAYCIERVMSGSLERCTYRGYEERVRICVKPDEIAKVRLGDLSTAEINRFLRRVVKFKGESHAKRVRTALGVIMKWGVGEAYLVINPVREAKVETSKRYAIDVGETFDDIQTDKLAIPGPVEAAAILAAADAWSSRAGAQLCMLFHGGMRPSEMLGLPVRCVN